MTAFTLSRIITAISIYFSILSATIQYQLSLLSYHQEVSITEKSKLSYFHQLIIWEELK